jgi:hypothetical protein
MAGELGSRLSDLKSHVIGLAYEPDYCPKAVPSRLGALGYALGLDRDLDHAFAVADNIPRKRIAAICRHLDNRYENSKSEDPDDIIGAAAGAGIPGEYERLLSAHYPFLENFYGSVLARAIVASAKHSIVFSRNEAVEKISASFIDDTGIGEERTLSVDFSDLEETLLKSISLLTSALNGKSDQFGAPTWALIVAERLWENALPIFRRTGRLDYGMPAGVRLAALCLAGEVDEMGRSDIGDMFRQVAAAFTLFQRRTESARYVPEVIMLTFE